MNARRSAAVWAAINSHVDGRPLSLEEVCLTCARMLHADGAAVALSGLLMGYEPVCASSPAAHQVMELHVTLGEGPGVTALADQRPVLVPDLAEADAQRRWPMFAPAALQSGTRALSAFPLHLGAISVGVLEISRTEAGWLTAEESADALVFADAALMVHIQRAHGPGGGFDGTVDSPHGTVERWAQVHQATGMIAAQAGTDLSAAFVRLRAHAFADERSLLAVAQDVVARRMRFPPHSE